MAGGFLLMGALALVLPVTAAFVAHGFIQLVANGWRAILHRNHVRWRTVGFYIAGSVAAAIAAFFIATAPSKPLLFLFLGLVSGLAWLPKGRIRLDAGRPGDALAAGVLVTGLNLITGVAGPLLDVFFVRTALTRHQIVATKAATQVFSHLAKIIVYGAPLLSVADPAMPPWYLFVAAAPLSIAGTILGGKILDRLTDARFISYTRLIITALGAMYLLQAAQLYFGF